MANFIGGAGGDALTGRAGADFIDGAGGDDFLRGRPGKDTLLGGAGADRLDAGWGTDLLDGGAGIDLADYSTATAGVRIDLRAGVGFYGIAQGDSLAGVENVAGSAFGDTLAGDAAANTLIGGDGGDFLKGRAGADTLFGGAGDDTLKGGGGNDRFEFALNFGADEIVGFAAGAGTGDVIRLVQHGDSAFQNFADILAASTQAGSDTVIDLGGGNTITLVGVDMTTLAAEDFSFRFLITP